MLDARAAAGGAARRQRSGPSRGSWSRSSARPARARRRSASCVPRIYDVRAGRCWSAGTTCATVTQQSLHDRIGVVSQDAHMFHDTIRANLLYAAPDATDDELWRRDRRRADRRPGALAAGRPRHRGRRPRLPALRRGEGAAGDRPAAAQGARDRHPRRGDRAPGQRERGGGAGGAGARARRPHVTGDRAPAVDRSSTPTPSWCSTTGGSSRPAPTTSCWPRAASTPSCTGPSSSSGRPPASSGPSREGGAEVLGGGVERSMCRVPSASSVTRNWPWKTHSPTGNAGVAARAR